MKYNPRLKADIEKYRDYVIIVEGKNDIRLLKKLGFERVYSIHSTSTSLNERVEEITQQLDKKDKICILTDFNKKGKDLYLKLKEMFQEKRIKLDSSLRGLLIKAQVSRIKDLDEFVSKVNLIG